VDNVGACRQMIVRAVRLAKTKSIHKSAFKRVDDTSMLDGIKAMARLAAGVHDTRTRSKRRLVRSCCRALGDLADYVLLEGDVIRWKSRL